MSITVLEQAFDAAAIEERNARAALKARNTAAGRARLAAATEAFDATLAALQAAQDAAEANEIVEDAMIAAATKTAEVAAQPSLF